MSTLERLPGHRRFNWIIRCVWLVGMCLTSQVLAQSGPTSDISIIQEETPVPVTATPEDEAPPVLDSVERIPATGSTTPSEIGPASDTDPWSLAKVLQTIWNAELFSASGSPIKLNQIVLALLIILIGVWISKRIAKMVRYRLARIQRIDSHAAAVIQTIVFNTLVVIIILAAMPIAGIPTTIFTVLGGAVAIGIGFGAQNLFNNLISSLIIMIERPIRLGDIVQVGEHEGLIEAINNRCTHLRRSDGIDLLIPNSQFLEQPVVNWTLSDRDVRGSVTVGVAYGSPTDKVAQLLRRCMDEHPKIHERPEPIILFKDFGDNALIFEAYFWSRITRPMDLKIIQSDVRFRFDQLCREAEIVIAFPQRDVHLDTLKPLEVKLVDQPKDPDS